MTDQGTKNDARSTAEVSVNWEGLKRFLGWQGSINELKRIQLDCPHAAPTRRTAADE